MSQVALYFYIILSLSLPFLGACCPSGVRLYGMVSNSLRVYWRNTGSSHSYITELSSSSNNYTCSASPGENRCDVANVQCGDIYNVTVAPLTPEGTKVPFCPQKLYSGMTDRTLLCVEERLTLKIIAYFLEFQWLTLFVFSCYTW